MSDWQPIETAPKEMRVFVFDPHEGMGVAEWSGSGDWFAAWGDYKFVDVGIEQIDLFVCYPTHWMPLPDPPK